MARSRRRRTTTERAAGLIALALPAPVQRVADTPLGSLLMLVGIPAMLVFGCLNIKFVDGFPTLSLNGQKAAELQRVASQQLSELEQQVVNQNWGAGTDLLRAAQNANPSYYPTNTVQQQAPNAAYLAQLQQYQWQQQQQQLQQRQAYQQSLVAQQNQYPYGQVNNQQSPYPQQQPYSNPGYQPQTYQPQAYQSQSYPPQSYPQQNFQGYQQPNYQPNFQQPNNQGQTAYHPSNQPTNQPGYGAYGQVPAQPTGYPIPVNQNNRIPLPSTTNSSQRQYNQPGSLLR